MISITASPKAADLVASSGVVADNQSTKMWKGL